MAHDTEADLAVHSISDAMQYLPGIKKLGRRNSRTLGFMPEGAFDERARLGHILVATLDDQLAGYLLYRIKKSSGVVSITHLCVDEKHRGRGIARALVTRLKSVTKNFTGIELWCRGAFPATELWPRVGFVNREERCGQRGDLHRWCFEQETAPQLKLLFDRPETESRLTVALDADVFFDLAALSDEDAPEADLDAGIRESVALIADWLDEHIHLCITPELRNEIARAKSRQERNRSRSFADKHFTELPASDTQYERACGSLQDILAGRRHDSDRRQLARAAAARADFFVTRDQHILNAAADIYTLLGLRVMSPSELIVQIDSAVHRTEYEPERLAGSRYTVSRLKADEVSNAVDRFLNTGRGEKKAAFSRRVRQHIREPDRGLLEVVRDGGSNMVGLAGWQVYEDVLPTRVECGILRLARGPMRSKLASRLVSELVQEAVSRRHPVTLVTEPLLSDDLRRALRAFGFRRLEAGWVKVSTRQALSALHLTQWIRKLEGESDGCVREHMAAIRETLRAAKGSAELLYAVERLLWPVKIVELDVPCYVVPIKPHWAMHLFDSDLAAQDLFGAVASLAFNRENVYYRASGPGTIRSPARILWYVSRARSVSNTGAIRAASYLEEVVVDRPKSVFRRFQPLGVFHWQEVFAIASNRLDANVMAMRFSDTETLLHPVGFGALQSILVSHGGRRNQIQAPVRIPAGAYLEIYRRGLGLVGKQGVDM